MFAHIDNGICLYTITEFRCTLLKSIMLQGFMYLTEYHICFHAYFPREQVMLKFMTYLCYQLIVYAEFPSYTINFLF